MKRVLVLLAAVCLLLTGLLTGCGDDGTGKGFRFPLSAEPRQLDPQVSTDASSITLISVLYEGLTRLDADGRAVPGAADWTVSEDGLTYTFTLRESYWSTISIRGEETLWDDPMMVAADDFVFGMQRAVSPATGSELASQLYGIRNAKEVHAGKKKADTLGVKAVSNRVLTITLTAPDENFPAALAATPFMPCNRRFFEYTAGRYGLEKEYILTNGPFLLTAWNHDESLLLNKNPYYHAADEVTPEAVRFLIDPEDAATSLQAGEIDAAPLTADQLDGAVRAGVQPVTLEDSIRSVYFNTASQPLSNASVRQALRDSVEWETVYGYLESVGELRAAGYVAPAATVAGGEIYRTANNAIPFTTNAQQAQAALGRGLAALYQQDTSPSLPRLSVLAAEDDISANLARYLIQSWQKNLKIYADLELVSESALSSRVRSGSYQVAIYTCTATGLTGAENLQAYATDGIDNYTGFSVSSVDAAVQKALRGGRAELTALEKLLWQQCPTLPLSFPRRYYGIAAGDEGVTVRPFGGGAYGSPFEFRQAKKWD